MSSNKLDFAGTGAGANHQESSNCEQQEEEMAGCQQNSCATCLKVLESNSKCDVFKGYFFYSGISIPIQNGE